MSRKTAGLVTLGCIALILRMGTVWAVSTTHAAPVTYEHGEIAENLLAGRGFSVWFLGAAGPTSQQSPLYPAMLAGLYACFGVASPAAILAMQLLQCAAGALLVLCVVWLSWSLIPERPAIGWTAGIGAALYPTHIYMATHIQVAPWAALSLAMLMAVAASRGWKSPKGQAVLAGGVAGIMMLFEPILMLAVPMAAVLLWHRVSRSGDRATTPKDRATTTPRHRTLLGHGLLTAPLKDRAPTVALFAGMAALVLLPWIGRNYWVHGEFVFVKSTFGYAFWQGNNPISWGTDKIPKPAAEVLRNQHDGTLAGQERALWEARHETLYIDDVLLKPTGYREFAGLNEPARARLLGRRAWQFIHEHPGQYLRLCAQRLRFMLLFDETNPKTANLVYRVSTAAWLLLAGLGVCLSRPHWNVLWPTFFIFAAVILFHTLTIASARFRIPVEPLSFVWAGYACVRIYDGFVSPSAKHQRTRNSPRFSHREKFVGDQETGEMVGIYVDSGR